MHGRPRIRSETAIVSPKQLWTLRNFYFSLWFCTLLWCHVQCSERDRVRIYSTNHASESPRSKKVWNAHEPHTHKPLRQAHRTKKSSQTCSWEAVLLLAVLSSPKRCSLPSLWRPSPCQRAHWDQAYTHSLLVEDGFREAKPSKHSGRVECKYMQKSLNKEKRNKQARTKTQ